MGKEFTVESLEDMCSLMCDNCLPRRRKGEEQKMWRVIELQIFGKPSFVMSDRKISTDELFEAISKTRFKFDLEKYGLPIAYETNHITAVFSTTTKKDALKVLEYANEKGQLPFALEEVKYESNS